MMKIIDFIFVLMLFIIGLIILYQMYPETIGQLSPSALKAFYYFSHHFNKIIIEKLWGR